MTYASIWQNRELLDFPDFQMEAEVIQILGVRPRENYMSIIQIAAFAFVGVAVFAYQIGATVWVARDAPRHYQWDARGTHVSYGTVWFVDVAGNAAATPKR